MHFPKMKILLFQYFCHSQKQTFMKAYVFPGQGAQYSGMGKELFESSQIVKNFLNLQMRF